jgi:hypothetical protein
MVTWENPSTARSAQNRRVTVSGQGDRKSLMGNSIRAGADQLRPLLRELRERQLGAKNQANDGGNSSPEQSCQRYVTVRQTHGSPSTPFALDNRQYGDAIARCNCSNF